MKALTLIFVALIALLQYPLWLGKGSWLRVWDLNRQIADQQEKNNGLKARNETLNAEVLDLKSGRAAIEERARSELGMVKQDEVFYQVLESQTIEGQAIENQVDRNQVVGNTTTHAEVPTSNTAQTTQASELNTTKKQ